MAEELREPRLSKQIPAKDMVAVVQQIYPKYDKTVQSKCENGEIYGVSLRPDAMAALYAHFAPEVVEQRKAAKKDAHRLTCRISARLETADYEALQQLIAADGYATTQDWLTAIVRRYIAKAGDAEWAMTCRIIPSSRTWSAPATPMAKSRNIRAAPSAVKSARTSTKTKI